MVGFFNFFKSSTKDSEPTQENNVNLTSFSSRQPDSSSNQDLQPVNLGATSMRMEPQPETKDEQMKLRGGGAGDCCCGICAGLCCFECCEICC